MGAPTTTESPAATSGRSPGDRANTTSAGATTSGRAANEPDVASSRRSPRLARASRPPATPPAARSAGPTGRAGGAGRRGGRPAARRGHRSRRSRSDGRDRRAAPCRGTGTRRRRSHRAEGRRPRCHPGGARVCWRTVRAVHVEGADASAVPEAARHHHGADGRQEVVGEVGDHRPPLAVVGDRAKRRQQAGVIERELGGPRPAEDVDEGQCRHGRRGDGPGATGRDDQVGRRPGLPVGRPLHQ